MRFFVNNKKAIKDSQTNLLKELEWAHIYHDSIRGKRYLENLPINVGRWAGNYSFFYVLNRILHEYKPKKIIEFGLGESSKFISICLDSFMLETEHLIIEQSEEWLDSFCKNFQLSERSIVKLFPLVEKKINGYDVYFYKNLTKSISDSFDLYVIDGPFGSNRYSRYNIVELAQRFTVFDEFIIMLDDCQREGERDTFNDLVRLFNLKGIKIFTSSYSGNKVVNLISTKKFKFSKSF